MFRTLLIDTHTNAVADSLLIFADEMERDRKKRKYGLREIPPLCRGSLKADQYQLLKTASDSEDLSGWNCSSSGGGAAAIRSKSLDTLSSGQQNGISSSSGDVRKGIFGLDKKKWGNI